MKHSLLSATLAGLVMAAPSVTLAATAGTIIGAQSATIDAGGPGFGNIADTHNQNGLRTNYVSGVTNFAAYNPGAVTHTTTFPGFEWFGNSGTTTAQVTYDLGAVNGIDKLALWNEESSGIGSLNLWYSVDGVNFTSLASGLTPTDWTVTDYTADIFSFAAVAARYVRFEMSGCPQPVVGSFQACAIGEVAFEAANVSAVPEPGSVAMMLAGLGLLGLSRRRRAG